MSDRTTVFRGDLRLRRTLLGTGDPSRSKEALMTDSQAMSCPVCRVPLVMSERQGVEIDYCPQCRGVWLDRGELDKILERSAGLRSDRDDYAPPRQEGRAYEERPPQR